MRIFIAKPDGTSIEVMGDHKFSSLMTLGDDLAFFINSPELLTFATVQASAAKIAVQTFADLKISQPQKVKL